MDYAMSLLQSYWGIIVCVLGFGVYALFQREQAKKIILSLMLRLEKDAKQFALQTGEDKFQYVVDKGYQLIPQGARIIITPAIFETLASNLYEQAKGYLVKETGQEKE